MSETSNTMVYIYVFTLFYWRAYDIVFLQILTNANFDILW